MVDIFSISREQKPAEQLASETLWRGLSKQQKRFFKALADFDDDARKQAQKAKENIERSLAWIAP
jgi:hypothetical protein